MSKECVESVEESSVLILRQWLENSFTALDRSTALRVSVSDLRRLQYTPESPPGNHFNLLSGVHVLKER